jgi:hypothetical protein
MVSFQPPDWGQISKALLDALCVVEAVDVGNHALPGFLTGTESTNRMDQFLFQD